MLAAGAVLPPNPGELLESRAMDAVLEQAKSTYDLVVIDTPPLTAVSDAFPLLTKVDGVVIVGRVGHSRRDAAEQLHQVLASSGAPLLGVIANGAKSGGGSARYYSGRRYVVAWRRIGSADASSSEEFAPDRPGLKLPCLAQRADRAGRQDLDGSLQQEVDQSCSADACLQVDRADPLGLGCPPPLPWLYVTRRIHPPCGLYLYRKAWTSQLTVTDPENGADSPRYLAA